MTPKLTHYDFLGLIHGDFNEQNIIVSPSGSGYGIIDFGDIHVTHYLFELAITLCYMMLQCVTAGDMDPLEGSGWALKGYMKERNVPQLELELLRVSKSKSRTFLFLPFPIDILHMYSVCEHIDSVL